MLNKGLFLGVSAMISASALAGVNELNQAATQLCSKVKVCIQQEVAGNGDIPASMKVMVDNMVSQMCQQFVSIAEFNEYHELVEPATACLESMAVQNCATLMESEQETPACAEYQKIADKYEN
ncbi:hypothetical protein FJ444_04285 [Aestuariibacter sp. GS-14]|uniref:hypothetical protein n=1 Tax=Alteromonadaceae TaxID=72275 RepID=UPI00112A62C5|nr:hypothetical protein [Aestuariibacter sp. GS-14]TPV60848.1 hypothetical protein FJ444_04285 [Aestuariibacter sp. GS-14]